MNNNSPYSQDAWLQLDDNEIIPLEEQFNVGRSEDCTLVIDSDEVSREHARLQYDEVNKHWMIIDMGSTNGTYINGHRLAKPQRLVNGDSVGIGSQTFVFHKRNKVTDITDNIPNIGDKTVTAIYSVPCWLVLLDVKQSTQLIQQLPLEEYTQKMRLWSKECKFIIARSNGRVNEYLGDGILAFWHHQPDTFELISSMLKQFELLESESDFDFRVMCHFGEVGFGGGMSSGLEKLAGTELNFLFKIEKSASTTGKKLILTEAAADLMADYFQMLEVGAYSIAGFQGEHKLFYPGSK